MLIQNIPIKSNDNKV